MADAPETEPLAPTTIGERQAIAEREVVVTSAGLTVDVDEGGDATILWPDGRWLDATPSGLITVGQSPSVRPARQYELDRLAAAPTTNAPVAETWDGLDIPGEARSLLVAEFPGDDPMDDAGRVAAGAIRAIEKLLAASLPIHGEMREALERIDQFVTNFRQPWESWKTVWWEGEVSDEAAFSADNALMHVANIARNALPSTSNTGSSS